VRSASAALRRPDAARVRGPGEWHPLPNSRGDQLRTARTRQSIPSLVRTISVIGTPASANTCGGLRVSRSAPRGRVTCSRSRAPSPEDSPTGNRRGRRSASPHRVRKPARPRGLPPTDPGQHTTSGSQPLRRRRIRGDEVSNGLDDFGGPLRESVVEAMPDGERHRDRVPCGVLTTPTRRFYPQRSQVCRLTIGSDAHFRPR
jgi:hypothetical protein